MYIDYYAHSANSYQPHFSVEHYVCVRFAKTK